ncbi:hypothetical protein HAX54_023072, partial [Datura stramonium]|nr:hypothetical protein [Datura stramonium]
ADWCPFTRCFKNGLVIRNNGSLFPTIVLWRDLNFPPTTPYDDSFYPTMACRRLVAWRTDLTSLRTTLNGSNNGLLYCSMN